VNPAGDDRPSQTEKIVGFASTHWDVVRTASDSSAPQSKEALEEVCRAYWPPVYAFVRRQGQDPDDALDLTQEFFARFLERKQVKLADPERGKFRTYLLTTLKNFLTNEWERSQAGKRGGGFSFISLDEQREAEIRYMAEPADPSPQPDEAFEKTWALLLLEQALVRLREEFSATGRQEHFDKLKVFLWGDQNTVSQVEVAAQLGMTPNALNVTVHRLRRRLGDLLRLAIAQTVAQDAEIDAELTHLIQIISR